MSKIIQDIAAKEVQTDVVIEHVRPVISPSKHVLDLREKRVLKTHRKPVRVKVLDVSHPKEILEKLYGHSFLVKEKRTLRTIQKKEILRLGVISLLVVFTLNLFNVYYEALRVRDSIVFSAYEGFSDLLQGSLAVGSEQLAEADFSFKKSLDNFALAKKELWFLEDSFIQGPAYLSAQGIIDGGKHLASSGKLFNESLQGILTTLQQSQESSDNDISFTDQLKNHYALFQSALEELKSADASLQNVSTKFLPEAVRPKLEQARTRIRLLIQTLENMDAFFPAVLKLLGDRYPHRILVLLQNNNEIRPTGGFLGSFLILDVNDGRIESTFHDVYDFDGQFHEYIEAPEEIQMLTDTWRMRDANYSPDFPTSAAKVAWFLEQEKGPGVDSVMAVDLDFARSLLELTGPIDARGIRFDARNFSALLSYIVESKLTGENSPKEILRDFIPQVQEKLSSLKEKKAVVPLLQKAVQAKHILAFSKDSEIQKLFDDLGVSGVFHPDVQGQDFVQITHSSIGGNKSDFYMEQSLQHRTFVEKNGKVQDQLTIKRKHTWDIDAKLELLKTLSDAGFDEPSDGLLDILGRGKNVSGMRIYVPRETTMVSSSGFDAEPEMKYDEDLELPYFYAVISVSPGEEKEFTVTYSLPFRIDISPVDELTFTFFKQPGSKNDSLIKEFHLSPSLELYRSAPKLDALSETSWSVQGSLENDLRFSALIGEKR